MLPTSSHKNADQNEKKGICLNNNNHITDTIASPVHHTRHSHPLDKKMNMSAPRESKYDREQVECLLMTPQRKSLQLTQEEKFPDILIEHARLFDPHSTNSKRTSTRSIDMLDASNNNPILEKSQAEEAEDEGRKAHLTTESIINMNLGCIQEQVAQCRSMQTNFKPECVSYYSHKSSQKLEEEVPARAMQSDPSQSQQFDRQLYQSYRLMNDPNTVIQRCALFWRKQHCTTDDYRDLSRVFAQFLDIRMIPTATRSIGSLLLQNGYFLLAYIKYVSMPQSLGQTSEFSSPEAEAIRNSLFSIYRRQYRIRTNVEEFEQAYQQNIRTNQSLLKSMMKQEPKAEETSRSSGLKRENKGLPEEAMQDEAPRRRSRFYQGTEESKHRDDFNGRTG